MTLEDLKTLLASTGLPVVYGTWWLETAPQMPYICYQQIGNNNFAADGIVFASFARLQITLVSSRKNPAVEALVESALSGLVWQATEDFSADDTQYIKSYEIEV